MYQKVVFAKYSRIEVGTMYEHALCHSCWIADGRCGFLSLSRKKNVEEDVTSTSTLMYVIMFDTSKKLDHSSFSTIIVP